MDAQIEGLVELYLTRGGQVFLSPQYDIPYSKEERDGGSCPDFVALDFGAKEIVVVEVTSAANLKSLYEKVEQRQTRWFEPIRRRLEDEVPVVNGWPIRFLGFVRSKLVDEANTKFSSAGDALFFALEEASFSYVYWTAREKGLPGARPKAAA
jgi:hypothetical protein